MLTIVTGWSPKGWREYAHRFAETFTQYWPKDVKIVSYVEEPQELSRIECRSLWDIPGAKRFIDKYRDVASANGREVKANWKPGCKAAGYNFRFDAWKFSRQGFIPWHAMQELKDGDFMAWFDADVITRKPVPSGWVESLMPSGKNVAYLGRAPKHSEIGFQLYRVGEEARAVVKGFYDAYNWESVFTLKEWHSAYVFDNALFSQDVARHNLTPGGSGNVWLSSPLIQYTDHLKGKRKHA